MPFGHIGSKGDSHEKLPSKTLGQLGAPVDFAQQQPKSDWLCPAGLRARFMLETDLNR